MITVIVVGLLDTHAVNGQDLWHKTFKSKEVIGYYYFDDLKNLACSFGIKYTKLDTGYFTTRTKLK